MNIMKNAVTGVQAYLTSPISFLCCKNFKHELANQTVDETNELEHLTELS